MAIYRAINLASNLWHFRFLQLVSLPALQNVWHRCACFYFLFSLDNAFPTANTQVCLEKKSNKIIHGKSKASICHLVTSQYSICIILRWKCSCNHRPVWKKWLSLTFLLKMDVLLAKVELLHQVYSSLVSSRKDSLFHWFGEAIPGKALGSGNSRWLWMGLNYLLHQSVSGLYHAALSQEAVHKDE